MVRGECQLGEVVTLQLDLRPPRHLEAERTEDVEDLVRDLSDGVMVAAFGNAAGQRHVERRRVQVGGASGAEQRGQPGFERRLDLGPHAIDAFTELAPLFSGLLAQATQNGSEVALFPKQFRARVAQLLLGSSSFESSARARPEGREARLDIECRVGHGVRAAGYLATARAASCVNAPVSLIAMSARILRSSSRPDFLRPAIRRE